MSAFLTWFEAQHGARQSCGEADDELQRIAAAGVRAQAELGRRQRWDDLKNSALYAWQIKDTDKR